MTPQNIKKFRLKLKVNKRKKERQHNNNPEGKAAYNHQTNRLKTKLNETKKASFYDCLHRHDNCQPIKTASKPLQVSPRIRKQTPTLRPWARPI